MISHTENITTENTTARIFELKEEKDFGGNEIPPCYLVDFLDVETVNEDDCEVLVRSAISQFEGYVKLNKKICILHFGQTRYTRERP